jgi:uncharacterized protein DUF4252
MKWISTLMLTLFIGVSLSAQVKAVEDFVKDHPDLKKYYIYQSTLRLLNQSGNEDFDLLIKNIRKINAYVALSGEDVTQKRYDKMISKLEKDDFDVLIRAKYNGAWVNLMAQSNGKNSYYVLAVRDSGDFALLEMDGQLDLNYLTALQDVDFAKLSAMLLEDDEKEEDH